MEIIWKSVKMSIRYDLFNLKCISSNGKFTTKYISAPNNYPRKQSITYGLRIQE